MSRRELMKSLPPGPLLPAALQLLATWKRLAASSERLRERYGKRFTVRLPFQPPLVMLSDPDDIRELFAAPPEVLHPGQGARVLEPIVGRNSVILLDEGLEIILGAVFGLKRGPRLDQLRDLLTELLTFSENPLSLLPVAQRLERWIPPLRRFNALVARADRLIFELVERRRADAATGEERADVLAMLLAARHEDGSPMSEQEIRDELVTALVAGHETTASQLAWAFERLSREPAVLATLVEELDAGNGEHYLTATIYEVMRLRPVLPNAEPRLTMRPIEVGGFRYPAGVLLLASAFLVHRDPEIYPEPYAFRPERFLENPPGTYTWIPFGGGRRRCLGASFALQEMRVVIRAALTRCELRPATAPAEPTRRRSITFSPAGTTVVLRDRAAAPAAPTDQELVTV